MSIAEVETKMPRKHFANAALPQYVDITTAASVIDVSRQHIYRLLKSGDLKSIRIPGRGKHGRQRIDIRDLQDFIKKHPA